MSNAVEPESRSATTRKQFIRSAMRRVFLVVLIVISVVSGMYIYRHLNPAPAVLTESEINHTIQQMMASATPPPAFSSQVYQVILPSLVYIQTKLDTEDEDTRFGVGSGVVINENGDILTAFHVVGDAAVIEIVYADGTQAAAVIIAADPTIDIAVLQSSQSPELIVPAILGNASAMRIGDEAFAVGNPLGLTASMSAGVISGFNRSLPIGDGEQRLDGLIQFDTAVNPGSSGGPLLNRQGQVVGIITALANPTGQNFFSGIGFAVPIGSALSAGGGGPSY